MEMDNKRNANMMADEELDNVAGGWQCGKGDKEGKKIVSSVNDLCDHWTCKTCGGTSLNGTVHSCTNGNINLPFPCLQCKYCAEQEGYGNVCTYQGA